MFGLLAAFVVAILAGVIAMAVKFRRRDRLARSPMAERKAFLLRVDPAVWAAIERLAQAELRSTNAQVEYLLREALARRGALPGDCEPNEAPASTTRGRIMTDFSKPRLKTAQDAIASLTPEQRQLIAAPRRAQAQRVRVPRHAALRRRDGTRPRAGSAARARARRDRDRRHRHRRSSRSAASRAA